MKSHRLQRVVCPRTRVCPSQAGLKKKLLQCSPKVLVPGLVEAKSPAKSSKVQQDLTDSRVDWSRLAMAVTAPHSVLVSDGPFFSCINSFESTSAGELR